MKVEQERNGGKLAFRIEGDINAATAPELKEVLDGSFDDDVTELVFDITDVPYISSAGLRVLLEAQNTIDDREGSMEVRGVNEAIMEILNVVGFTSFLNITAADDRSELSTDDLEKVNGGTDPWGISGSDVDVDEEEEHSDDWFAKDNPGYKKRF